MQCRVVVTASLPALFLSAWVVVTATLNAVQGGRDRVPACILPESSVAETAPLSAVQGGRNRVPACTVNDCRVVETASLHYTLTYVIRKKKKDGAERY